MDQNENGQNVFRCQKCGHILNPEHKFCSTCGAPNAMFHNKPTQMDHEDLPVINTDDIFGEMEPELPKVEIPEEKEEALPVIDVDGLFDDVPFANTSNYQHEPVPEAPMNNQYYMEENKQPYQPQHEFMNENFEEEPEDEEEDFETPEGNKKKSKKKKFIIIGVAVAAVIIGLLCFLLFRSKGTKADLMDICGYTVTGYNGTGKVEFEFNEKCDLYSNFFVKDQYDACNELKKVTFSATPNENLKNGDTVTIVADYSKADLSKFKIKVKNDRKQIQIADLKDGDAYDLFQGVTIKYDGYEGYATATIDTTGCDDFIKDKVKFSFEGNHEKLKNGDKVVVKAEVSDKDLEEKHYQVESKTKEYNVEGISDSKAYDVFEKLKITYEGASPNVSLKVDTSACDDFVKNKVQFELSSESGVSIGDKITITAKFDEEEAKTNGYNIEKTTKTVTVDKVSTYLAKISSKQASTLNSKLLSKMSSDENKNGTAYIFDRVLDSIFEDGETYSLVNTKKETALRYFLYSEDKEQPNSYILIMKYTITASNVVTGEKKDAVVYAESSISNIILDGDGKTLRYDEPSEVVTDTDLNYFINQVNKLGYSITSL